LGPIAAVGIAQLAENAPQAGALPEVGGVSVASGGEGQGGRFLAAPGLGARSTVAAVEGVAGDFEALPDAFGDRFERRRRAQGLGGTGSIGHKSCFVTD
jgi:hypothetical protein